MARTQPFPRNCGMGISESGKLFCGFFIAEEDWREISTAIPSTELVLGFFAAESPEAVREQQETIERFPLTTAIVGSVTGPGFYTAETQFSAGPAYNETSYWMLQFRFQQDVIGRPSAPIQFNHPHERTSTPPPTNPNIGEPNFVDCSAGALGVPTSVVLPMLFFDRTETQFQIDNMNVSGGTPEEFATNLAAALGTLFTGFTYTPEGDQIRVEAPLPGLFNTLGATTVPFITV